MGESSGMAELGLRLVGSLAVVVGLLILIARVVNRRFKPTNGAPVRVVHRQALSRGSGVAVVTVGTRVLVLGTTEQQVTLLTEVEPDEIGLDEEYGDEAVASPGPADGALAGSVLSPQTWKQAWAMFGRSTGSHALREGRGATTWTAREEEQRAS